MKSVHRNFLLAGALLLPLVPALLLSPAPPAAAATSALDFRNDMRRAWEDHIVWTRLAIVAILDDAPEQEAAVTRLLRNQADIGNAVKPYYGDAAGDQLTALLREHITGAAELLTAAKAGDSAKINAASAQWYANGDDIATFLHNANPRHWPLDTMQAMMKGHLDQTVAEALANLQRDYPADVIAYDAVHEHILMMADALSAGIINQFPDRFGLAPVPGMPRTGAAPAGGGGVWLVLLAGLGLAVGRWFLRGKSAPAPRTVAVEKDSPARTAASHGADRPHR